MEEIMEKIMAVICQNNEKKHQTCIAVDGFDASGKTHFAQKIQTALERQHIYSFVVAIDDFHQPKAVRYNKGKQSAEGFFTDSYAYNNFLNETLKPFKNGEKYIKTKHFDLETDQNDFKFTAMSHVDVLLVEGIFLNRKELYSYWDFSIFLDISLEESLSRNVSRTLRLGSELPKNTLSVQYKSRYVEGQKIYLARENPKDKANIIVDNTDFNHPKILENKK